MDNATEKQQAFVDLVEHAKEKLAEEDAYYASLARQGKKPHGRRNDRRPLWAATIVLAEAIAKKPPPDAKYVHNRGAAWDYLCNWAKRKTAQGSPFIAIIELRSILSLPDKEEAKAVLRAREVITARREEAKKMQRVERLRDELRQLEGDILSEDAVLPDNVVRFPVARAG